MRAYTAILAACALFAATTSVPAALDTSGDVSFNFCPNSPATITVKKLSFSPFPPGIKTKVLTVTAGGLLTTTVNLGAKMVVVAKLGSLTVATQNFDICAESAKAGLNCPIAPGAHDLVGSVDMPTGIQIPPFVGIDVEANAYNADGSKLFCVQTKVKFVP